jgi:hypothetical protein
LIGIHKSVMSLGCFIRLPGRNAFRNCTFRLTDERTTFASSAVTGQPPTHDASSKHTRQELGTHELRRAKELACLSNAHQNTLSWSHTSQRWERVHAWPEHRNRPVCRDLIDRMRGSAGPCGACRSPGHRRPTRTNWLAGASWTARTRRATRERWAAGACGPTGYERRARRAGSSRPSRATWTTG